MVWPLYEQNLQSAALSNTLLTKFLIFDVDARDASTFSGVSALAEFPGSEQWSEFINHQWTRVDILVAEDLFIEAPSFRKMSIIDRTRENNTYDCVRLQDANVYLSQRTYLNIQKVVYYHDNLISSRQKLSTPTEDDRKLYDDRCWILYTFFVHPFPFHKRRVASQKIASGRWLCFSLIINISLCTLTVRDNAFHKSTARIGAHRGSKRFCT